MSTLITGGTGMIGSSLAEKLLQNGETVVLFDAMPAEWRIDRLRAHGDRLVIRRGDVQSLAELLDTVRAHGIRAIVHLAFFIGPECETRPEKAVRINVQGAVNVLEAARLGGVERIAFASSIAVYGSDLQYPGQLPVSEDVPLWVARGWRVYGSNKVLIEHLAQRYAEEYGLVTNGLRASNVYGWGRSYSGRGGLTEWIDRVAVGEPVRVGYGEDEEMSVVYLEDVVEQFMALLRADPVVLQNRRFYNSGGDSCTMGDLVTVVRRLVPTARIELTPPKERRTRGTITRVSDRALVTALGYERRFTPLEVGVRAYLEAARARPRLSS